MTIEFVPQVVCQNTRSTKPPCLKILGDYKARASFKTAPDGSVQITAPLRVFKIASLELLASNFVAALTKEFGNDASIFDIQSGIVLDKYHQCQAVVLVECEHDLDDKRCHQVVDRLLKKIKQRDTKTGSLFRESENVLATETVAEIDVSANAILSSYGGGTITAPASVFCGEQEVGNLRGRFAPRPDISNLISTQIEVTALFDGYRLLTRSIFLEGDIRIVANWETDFQRTSITSLANRPGKLCNFRLDKTLDQRGKPLYTFVDWTELT